MSTFKELNGQGVELYEYIAGSNAHGIATPTSDTDVKGVFICPIDNLVDLGLNYNGQYANESNDIVWYELNKFMSLLIKSNPTILEALFVDDKHVLYEHPVFSEIKVDRDLFLTKQCFSSFFSYAQSQIKKAKGLNKKINWDIPERKEILDFAYTFHKQGSSKILNWLEYRGLKQDYCGLVNIPNMPTIFGCYYDWGNHFLNENVSCDDLIAAWNNSTEYDTIKIVKQIKEEGREDLKDVLKQAQFKNMVKFIVNFYKLQEDDLAGIDVTAMNITKWYNVQKPIGYRGMVNNAHTSNELRLSSVSKGEMPICYISYYQDSFSQHCRRWIEYQDWVEHRNPVRYESNLHKSYDAKNMCECFRLINCGIEIANGEGYKVDRSKIDAKFLLDIKAHKFEYDYLINLLEEKNKEMNEAMANSKIQENIDVDYINDMLLNIRHKQLGGFNSF